MSTYGKKKRSILPSFSSLRDPDANSRSKEKNKGKTMSQGRPVSHSRHLLDAHPGHHDDSIGYLASMLLEDTTVSHLKAGVEIQGPHTAAAKSSPDNNFRPGLPQLQFDGDNPWNQTHFPAMSASTDIGEIYGFDSSPFDAKPPIPRRSSKRNSAHSGKQVRDQQVIENYRGKLGSSSELSMTTIPSPASQCSLVARAGPSTINAARDVNDKIEAMIAATKALKGSEPSLPNAVSVTSLASTRRRLDHKLYTRVKSVLNERRVSKNRRESAANDNVDVELVLPAEATTPEHATSSINLIPSSVERRMAEGNNFRNPKISTLTGHGNVKRKPIADDGRSLKSRASSDDPFSTPPPSRSKSTRPSNNFEHQLIEDVAMEDAFESTPELPTRTRSFHGPPEKKIKKASLFLDTDIDALFSSSPIAQSTPRIRLEPTFENGKPKLKHVPADSVFMFDPDHSNIGILSDMEIDSPFDAASEVTRSAPAAQFYTDYQPYQGTKRVKKHPSPSKSDLEKMELDLRNIPDLFARGESPNSEVYMSMTAAEPHGATTALTKKDGNANMAPPIKKPRGFGLFLKPELSRSALSMPNILKRGKSKSGASSTTTNISSARNPSKGEASRAERHISRDRQGGGVGESSMMDIDELQWDTTALLRRV